MSVFPYGIENNLLWKTAARAGLRRISRMVAGGDIAGANRLATTPGVLKKTMAGSQIKQLGTGMEGSSTLVAHPKRGLEVQKVIDPRGIAGQGMVDNREAFGKAMQHSSDVAQFRGAYDSNGLRVQRFEYAPGQRLSDAGMQGIAEQRGALGVRSNTPVNAVHDNYTPGKLNPQQRANAQMRRVELQGQRAGFDVRDLHSDNMTLPQAGGSGKVIDTMLVPHKGTVGLNQPNFEQAMHAQDTAAQGGRTPYLDYLQDPRRAGNLRAQAFAGAAPLTPESSTALHRARNPQAPLQSTGGGVVTQPAVGGGIQSEKSPQIGGASIGSNISTAIPASRKLRTMPAPVAAPAPL